VTIASPTAATPYIWSFEPSVALGIVVAGGAYAWRLHELAGGRRKAARDYLRGVAFAAGLLVVALALMSPIDSLGERRLFSVHMAQHLLITDIAPILLLLGLSRPILRPVVRRVQPLERALGPVAHPVTALVVAVGVIWLWHLPAMYEAALHHPLVHNLEHMSFFAGGLAFWWYVIEPVPPRHRLRGLATVAYVTAAKLLLGGLGLVLAFSQSPFYDTYEHAPRMWGMSALADQNVGGLLMMFEQSTVLAIFFAIVFARMLERSEQAERRRERLGL
jgi:cytochrome c oxidase assembly factor CtaG